MSLIPYDPAHAQFYDDVFMFAAPKFDVGATVSFVAWSAGGFDFVPGVIRNAWRDESGWRYDIQRYKGVAYQGIYEANVKGREPLPPLFPWEQSELVRLVNPDRRGCKKPRDA